MLLSRAWSALLFLLFAGCGADPSPAIDAGADAAPDPLDSGTIDAGGDAGGEDAGEGDAGALDDTGPPDAGRPADAGADAGPPPSGCDRLDAARPDAGMLPSVLDPAAFTPARGPGGPRTPYPAAMVGTHCASIGFGPTDERHHNTGFMLDGYLIRPWAHERGRGGIAVFEIDDPCSPVPVANVLDDQIRETHATGMSNLGGHWIAVASLRGIQFWDVSDITAPRMAHDMVLPGVVYPDSYMRVVMSVFWQAPYVFVGASDNGIFIVDASDPTNPRLVTQYTPTPFFRVGNVHVVGNYLIAMASENAGVAIIDVSVPDSPRPIPGGAYNITGTLLGRRTVLPQYFGHVSGGYTWHARSGLGGGLIVYDIHDPTAPRYVSDFTAPGTASGGYVFLHEDVAFVGESNYGHAIDVSDVTMPRELMLFDLPGDVDTATPLGNVVLLSVDDDAEDGIASVIIPWREQPSMQAPRVSWVVPADGATSQAVTTRVGLTFSEFVAMESVWPGSVQVREQGSTTPIAGHYSGQEGVINFWPAEPLRPGTTYEVFVPAGGVHDISGTPSATEHRSTFTTETCP